MERTRAAVAYIETTPDPGVELAAFMALFHPDHDPNLTRQMVHEARKNRRDKR